MLNKKHEYYLEIAKAVALKSTCIRAKYGAIIVKNDAIVSTGYNGPARGSVNCNELKTCPKEVLNLPHGKSYDFCPAVHAEENAVINASRTGAKVLGGILYLVGIDKAGKVIKGEPCIRCRRVLINAGIEKVITTSEDKEIIIYNVSNWIEIDKSSHIKLIEEILKKCE